MNLITPNVNWIAFGALGVVIGFVIGVRWLYGTAPKQPSPSVEVQMDKGPLQVV